MADPEEVKEWLSKAEEDRLVVEVLLQTGEELTLPCMFHLQQMLEKLLIVNHLFYAQAKKYFP